MNAAQRKALEQAYKEEQAKLPPCPKAISVQTGCKVAFHVYATLADAEVASQWARLQAEYLSYFGYEYGYFSGGEILEGRSPDGFTVVFP